MTWIDAGRLILQQRILRLQTLRFLFEHHRDVVTNRKCQSISATDQHLLRAGVLERPFADGAREDIQEFGVHARSLPLSAVPTQHAIHQRGHLVAVRVAQYQIHAHIPVTNIRDLATLHCVFLCHQDR
jgi:hypothetical protein